MIVFFTTTALLLILIRIHRQKMRVSLLINFVKIRVFDTENKESIKNQRCHIKFSQVAKSADVIGVEVGRFFYNLFL